jgi:hypothetical protein
MIRAPIDIFQNAWVVDDLEAAMQKWLTTFGVGPFFVAEHIKVADFKNRGRASDLDFSVALAQAGTVQVELIVQHNEVPSLYRDLVPAGADGFHHVGIFAKDYDRELAAYVDGGCEIAAEGRFGSMRFAYVDTSPSLGFMLEILEESTMMRDHFKMIADAARGWNGKDPVRSAW